MPEAAPAEVEEVEPEVLGADPQAALSGRRDAHDAVRAEAARVRVVVLIARDLALSGLSRARPPFQVPIHSAPVASSTMLRTSSSGSEWGSWALWT